MIATVDISVQAANPSMPLFPMRAFEGSPSSIRIRNMPKRIGDWVIDKVYFAVTYPDNTTQTIECKLVGGVYVGTTTGCDTIGNVKNGYSIFADGKDENGNAVTNYCLGKGDVQILDARGITQPLQNTTFVQILSAHPATPNDGDMWYENDTWFVWQNGQALPLGDDSSIIGNLTERVDELSTELSSKLDISAFNDFKADELTAYTLSVDVQNELTTKADTSSLTAYALSDDVSAALADKRNYVDLSYVRHLDYSKPQEILGFSVSLNATTETITKITHYSENVWRWKSWNANNAYTIWLDLTDSEHPIFIYGPSTTYYYTTFTIPDGATSFSHTFDFSGAGNMCTISLLTEDTIALRNDNISQFRNDADYITKEQVNPDVQYSGWAAKARVSMGMNTEQFLSGATTYPYEVLSSMTQCDFGWLGYDGGALRITSHQVYPWILSTLSGTSFDPVIEMKWGYQYLRSKRGSVIRTLYQGPCWKSPLIDGTTTYLINNDCDKFYIITGDPSRTGFYTGSSYKTITLASGGLSVETYDGQTEQIVCTRQGTINDTTPIVHYVAFEDDLSAGLSTKQDKLTDTQISAICSVVDERATIVKHLDNTISSYNIEGTLTHKSIPTIREAVEVHIGRGVTDIGSSAFNGCNNLTAVSIPDSITSIGTFAFWGCGGLESVMIPGSTTRIGEAAFQNCSALSMVNINDGIVDIAEGAFSGCTNLTSVVIPDSVTDIGSSAFQGCSSLTTVDIGNGINNMGDSIFEGCDALYMVTFKDTTMLYIQSVATYPFGINNPTTVIKTWNAASQEWVTGKGYATRFNYSSAFIQPFGRMMTLQPYAVNTFTTSSTIASFTISVNGTAGTLMRELYFTLTLGSGVTSQPIAWNEAIDVFQGGSADAVAPTTGVNLYHIIEYTSGHFAVQKMI